MIDDGLDEPQAMLAVVAIARMACAMPTDLAIQVLMTVVAEMIQVSPNATEHWATLAAGVEAYRQVQRRLVPGPGRLQ